jgi:hypothetical protein
MAEKKAFVLRIDETVYKNLEKWAADEFRSVNGQIEWILLSQLKAAKRYKEAKTPKPKA